eukprot:GHVS01103491.1.p1 GENE.GHVS01103491.1~~GHVS01103491.1.p1  ORF type:complete len:410 (+),score=67.52 GHVS01103491.1:151-1380(+)
MKAAFLCSFLLSYLIPWTIGIEHAEVLVEVSRLELWKEKGRAKTIRSVKLAQRDSVGVTDIDVGVTAVDVGVDVLTFILDNNNTLVIDQNEGLLYDGEGETVSHVKAEHQLEDLASVEIDDELNSSEQPNVRPKAALRLLGKKKHHHRSDSDENNYPYMPYPGFFAPPFFPPYPYPPPIYTRPPPPIRPTPIMLPQPSYPATVYAHVQPQPLVQPMVQPMVQPWVQPTQVVAPVFRPRAPPPRQPDSSTDMTEGIQQGLTTGLNLIGALLKSGLGSGLRNNGDTFEDILDLEFRPDDPDFDYVNNRKKPTTITSDTLVSIDALEKLSLVLNNQNSQEASNDQTIVKTVYNVDNSSANENRGGQHHHHAAYVEGYEDGYVEGYGDGVDTGESVTKSLWCSIDTSHPLCTR